ncbi:hypothetical protein HMPREF3265_00040 [Staphylococcus sp. HMSC62B09]|uniref:hypothetical protein n=1 Tax=Staphylococcus sp. HMSC62B09 TaxID=1608884 RepID=UPI0008AA1A04|nr:hypothetical protein [Staphylococcus sp. HMSC62B09]OHS36201.1 hypothetical protein HMPREF3265_00040 [Staphylococcus sp. HMSC62B09]HAR5874408.1 hypothetical protein [Staphylococcus pseudintermedius]HAR5933056.1 hypothetical protein [Staphylococcus pseudintermedius]
MKKKLISTVTGVMLLSSLSIALPQTPLNPIEHKNVAKAEGKVIAKQTISKKSVKQMAKEMPKRQKNYKEWGATAATLFGKYGGPPVAAAVLASANAQNDTINTFKKAAKQNKRVQVIIKTGPTPNLQKISYKII